MEKPQSSAQLAEPPGSPKSSPVISGLLRDAQDTVEMIRTHNIPLERLPHSPRIEEIEGETTLFLNQIMGTGDGGAMDVHVSFNGKALIAEHPMKTDKPGTSADLQELLNAMPRDISGMRLIALAQEFLGRVQTTVLRLRPSVDA